MTSAQRIALYMVTFPLIAIAILIFAVAGYAPLVAVIGGLWWGFLPVFLAYGVSMGLAPAAFIRWREEAMARQRSQLRWVDPATHAKVGNWFSNRLAISGPHPWESATAQQRVRRMGIAYIVIGIGVAIVPLLLRWM